MTWHAGCHSKELRNRSAGLHRRIRDGRKGTRQNFQAAQKLLMPRRINIERATRCKAVTWNPRTRAPHLHVKMTRHPWDPIVKGLRALHMLPRWHEEHG